MIIQQVFNKDFNSIVDEAPNYIKDSSKIPNSIYKFIYNDSIKRPIYDEKTGLLHCSKCLCELDNKMYCSTCKIKFYKDNSNNQYSDIYNIYEYVRNNNCCISVSYYIYFDKYYDNVLMYILKVNSYNHWSDYRIKISIDKVYYITNDYYRNLIDDYFVYYNDLDVLLNNDDSEDNEIINELYDTIFSYCKIINIDILKNSIYRYSNIWMCLDTIEKNNDYCLFYLVYLPLHNRLFEYLVKLGLYNLSFSCMNFNVEKESFNGVFNLSKDYLDFMRDNDLNYEEFRALQMCKSKDIELVRLISIHRPFFLLYKDFNISPLKVIKYFNDNKYSFDNLWEYYDYILMSSRQGFDILDKKILFPKDFIEEHNRLAVRDIIIDDEDINKRIYPAYSVESMVEEAKNQHNCLISYCSDYSNFDCQIFFLRRKSSPNISYVTIELDSDNNLVQARTKFNELPSDDVMNTINKWLDKSIEIQVE